MEEHIFPFEQNTEDIVVRLYRHGSIDAHTHEFLELVYVVEGQAAHTLNGQCSVIGPGSYFIVDYASRHQYETPPGKEIVLYNLLFTPRFIDRTLASCHRFDQILDHYLIRFQNIPAQFPQNTIFFDENGSILQRIQNMEKEGNEQKPGFAELLRCSLIEIIIQSLRKLSPEVSNVRLHPCVCAILDQINRNYMTNLTLTALSQDLHYSPAYLSRLFAAETGESFHNLLRKKRIENSCRLLLNTHKQVQEIAQLVGYADLKTFQSAFKQIMHTTPKAYQKQNH